MSNKDKQPKAAMPKNIFTSATSILLLAIILLALNFIFGKLYFKVDMTSEKIYTLSNGTLSILKNLEDKIKIKFYFSKSVANVPFQYKLYGQRVQELLEEYKSYNPSFIDLEINDPQPDTDEQEWAVKYGLTQAALPGGDTFYLGLVAIVADKEEVIPFFNLEREEFLEYDLSRSISQVSTIKRPTIGIMTPLNIVGSQAGSFAMPQQATNDWLFLSEIRKSFEVISISTEADSIPKEISLLMVIHPKNLSELTSYAIDQYVLNGGKAIVMVDPSSKADEESDPSNPYMAMMNKSSDLPKLFKAWGIKYDKNQIVADNNSATKVNYGSHGVHSHPMWMTLKQESMSPNSVISAKLNSMMMIEAGAISKEDASNHEFVPVVQTSDSGNFLGIHQMMTTPEQMTRSLQTNGKTLTLAALVRGKFDSAFAEPPQIPVPEDETETQKTAREAKIKQLKDAHLATAENTVSVLVVADTDLLKDEFCARAMNFFGNILLQPLNDNISFISNATDFLAGSEDLINIRSRNKATRTFTRVEAIERNAQKKWLEEEQALTAKLERIQQTINELQAKRQDGERLILTAEQRKEIDKANNEKYETMKKRRSIRKLLRQDIETLGTVLTSINMLLMPLIVILYGAFVYLMRNNRRKTA